MRLPDRRSFLTTPQVAQTSGGGDFTPVRNPNVNAPKIHDVLQSTAKVMLQAQNDVNEAKALEQDNSAAEEFNWEIAQYEQLNGSQAVGAAKDYKSKLQEIKKKYSQGLDNEVQKRMVGRVLDRRLAMASGRVDKHYINQSSVYKAGQLKARVDNDVNEAVANLQTYGMQNGAYDLSVDKINRSLNELAEMGGISPENQEKMNREVYTGLHNLAVNKLVSEDRSKAASQYLKDNKDSINQATYLKLSELVKISGLKGSTFELSNKITAKHTGIGEQIDRLNEMRDTGKISDALFSSTRTNLIGQHNFRKSRVTEWKNDVVVTAQQWLDANKGVPIGRMPTDLAKNLLNTGKYNDMVRYSNNGRYVTEDKGFFVKLTSSDVLENMTEQQYYDNYRTKLNNRDYDYGNVLREEINSEENQTQLISTNDIIKNTAKTLNIIPWKGTSNASENQNMYEFETRIQALVNNFETGELQGKRKASTKEVNQIISDALLDKVWIGGILGFFQEEVPVIGVPSAELEDATKILESGEKISLAELGSVKSLILENGGDPNDEKTISEVHGIMTGRRKGIIPTANGSTIFPEGAKLPEDPPLNKDVLEEDHRETGFTMSDIDPPSVAKIIDILGEPTPKEIVDYYLKNKDTLW